VTESPTPAVAPDTTTVERAEETLIAAMRDLGQAGLRHLMHRDGRAFHAGVGLIQGLDDYLEYVPGAAVDRLGTEPGVERSIADGLMAPAGKRGDHGENRDR
jgi:hypothetical protein